MLSAGQLKKACEDVVDLLLLGQSRFEAVTTKASMKRERQPYSTLNPDRSPFSFFLTLTREGEAQGNNVLIAGLRQRHSLHGI